MTNVPFRICNNPGFDPIDEAHPWMTELEDLADAAMQCAVDRRAQNFCTRPLSRPDDVLWQQDGGVAYTLWRRLLRQVGGAPPLR